MFGEKLAYGIIIPSLTTPSPVLDFLENAEKYNHKITKLIVCYKDHVSNHVLNIISKKCEIRLLKRGDPEWLIKQLHEKNLTDIVLAGIVIKYDKYLQIKSRILSEAGIKEDIELSKIEMFKKFSKKELREILSISEMKTIIKGDHVFRSGDLDTGIYFLIKGQLEIRKKSRDLKHEYVVSKLNQGEHFNETAIFFTEPHRVSVYAVTDAKLMRIDKDRTLELVKKNTQLSNKLLWWISKKLTERLTQTTQKYSDSQERSTDLSDNMDT